MKRRFGDAYRDRMARVRRWRQTSRGALAPQRTTPMIEARRLDENPKGFLSRQSKLSRRILEGLVTSEALGYEGSML